MPQKIILAILVLAFCSCTSNQFVLSDNAALWQNIEHNPGNYKTDNTTDSASTNLLLYCANENNATTKQQLRNYKLTRKQVVTNTRQTKRYSKQIVAHNTPLFSKNPKPKLYHKPRVTISDNLKNVIEFVLIILGVIVGLAAVGWLFGWLAGLIFASSGVGFAWAWMGAIIGGSLGLFLVIAGIIVFMILFPKGYRG